MGYTLLLEMSNVQKIRWSAPDALDLTKSQIEDLCTGTKFNTDVLQTQHYLGILWRRSKVDFTQKAEQISALGDIAETNLAALAAAVDVQSEMMRIEGEIDDLEAKCAMSKEALEIISESLLKEDGEGYLAKRKDILRALRTECYEEMVEVFPIEHTSLLSEEFKLQPEWIRDALSVELDLRIQNHQDED